MNNEIMLQIKCYPIYFGSEESNFQNELTAKDTLHFADVITKPFSRRVSQKSIKRTRLEFIRCPIASTVELCRNERICAQSCSQIQRKQIEPMHTLHTNKQTYTTNTTAFHLCWYAFLSVCLRTFLGRSVCNGCCGNDNNGNGTWQSILFCC